MRTATAIGYCCIRLCLLLVFHSLLIPLMLRVKRCCRHGTLSQVESSTLHDAIATPGLRASEPPSQVAIGRVRFSFAQCRYVAGASAADKIFEYSTSIQHACHRKNRVGFFLQDGAAHGPASLQYGRMTSWFVVAA